MLVLHVQTDHYVRHHKMACFCLSHICIGQSLLYQLNRIHYLLYPQW